MLVRSLPDPRACVQCASLANSAGIGGGPLYMPLFNVILGFNLKASTALSHTTVTVSAVSSSLCGCPMQPCFWLALCLPSLMHM